MREISPPEATFSRGRGSSPTFGETRNSTRSAPFADHAASCRATRKTVRSMASCASSASTRFSSLRAAACAATRSIRVRPFHTRRPGASAPCAAPPCARRPIPLRRSGGAPRRRKARISAIVSPYLRFSLPIDDQARLHFFQTPGIGLQVRKDSRAVRKRPPARRDPRPSDARAALPAWNRCGRVRPGAWLRCVSRTAADSGES